MHLILASLFLSAIILCFLCSLILFAKNEKHRREDLFLAIAFLCMSFFVLRHFLIYSEVILVMPVLLVLLNPFFYFIPPCIYLYMAMSLGQADGWSKYYWWHFLPALVMVADVVPWCLLSAGERYVIVFRIVQNPESLFMVGGGYLPNLVHFSLRLAQGVFYIVLEWRLILSSNSPAPRLLPFSPYLKIYRWCQVLTAILTITCLLQLIYLFIYGINRDDGIFIRHLVFLPSYVTAGSFLIQALYLYFNPGLLYGAVDPAGSVNDAVAVELAMEVEVKSLYADDLLRVYKECLLRELEENKIFMVKGLTVTQLAGICEIPVRALAYLFIHTYGKGFSDYINEYRLRYIVERMHSSDWKLLTIEGLAMEAGFASRTTFFQAFKKKYGMNPSSYLASIAR